MTSLERKHTAELARKAAVVQKTWLREREERRAMLATANAAIKQRWIESDSLNAKTATVGQHCGEAEMTGQARK
jgi:hypothetical protein